MMFRLAMVLSGLCRCSVLPWCCLVFVVLSGCVLLHHCLLFQASATKPSTRHLCTTTVPSRVAAQHQLLPA